MKKKSVFKLLYKYRNECQKKHDNYYKLFRKRIKVIDFEELVEVSSDITTKAYLSNMNNSLVIINNDGYIDNIIYLFDKYLTKINTDDILLTTKKLLNNYYKSTKIDFIEDLFNLEFISKKLYLIIKKECLL